MLILYTLFENKCYDLCKYYTCPLCTVYAPVELSTLGVAIRDVGGVYRI
jgi:hypothetical protein